MIDRNTAITIDCDIKERLRNLKLTPHESYENTIIRLIEKHWGGEKNDKKEM